MNRSLRSSLGLVVALLVGGACASREDVGPLTSPPLVPGDCTQKCSEDGASIVNCQNEVVSTCAAYSSCVDGLCVPGCERATQMQSSVGCEYYAAKPATFLFSQAGPKNDGSCYAVMIANTWSAPVELQVEYDGKPISSSYFRIPRGHGADIRYELLPEGKVPAGELAILFLAMEPDPPFTEEPENLYKPCPASVGAAVLHSAAVRGNGIGKMFHIRSTAPVTAYDIYPYGGAKSYFPSSSLLLPTSAWGTENLGVDGYEVDEVAAIAGGSTYIQVLARDNDTHIKVKPTAVLPNVGNHPPVKPGEIGEYVLQSGEFVQFAQAKELNGTGVESDKPVSLVGGATCMKIPGPIVACDTMHQQLPPIRLFGDTYVATRYRDRGEPEQTPWLVMSAADGTKLTYDPPIPDAPATLDRGQWKEFWAPGPFVVKSQDKDHPIYAAAYMTGSGMVANNMGDPEMVNIVPVGQYLSSYLFLTDPTYGNTNLVFVRGGAEGKHDDVTLDCVGVIDNWQNIGNTEYQVAYVDLVRDGAPQGTCDNGVHRASSKSPFALTVWGYDVTASYGFPAGMGTKILNDLPAIQ